MRQVKAREIGKKSKRGFFIKLLLMLLLFVFSLLVVIPLAQNLGEGDTVALGEMFSSMDWTFAIYAAACVLALIVIGGARLTHITSATSGKILPLGCLRIFLLGKFYDNITPLSTGGQPFEIYELTKKGIAGGIATAIPLIRYFIQMFTITPISLALFLFCGDALQSLDVGLRTLVSVSAYIGMGVFMIIPVFLAIVSVLPRFGMKIARGIIKLGSRLKIVKNYELGVLKAEQLVLDFKSAMKYAACNVFHVLSVTVLSILEMLITYCIPFFLCVAMGDVSPTLSLLFQTATLNAYAYFAVSFLPTPGNSGFSESMFALVFASVSFGQNVIFWLVLLWRFLTYYIYIIIGLIILLFDFLKKRLQKKASL